MNVVASKPRSEGYGCPRLKLWVPPQMALESLEGAAGGRAARSLDPALVHGEPLLMFIAPPQVHGEMGDAVKARAQDARTLGGVEVELPLALRHPSSPS